MITIKVEIHPGIRRVSTYAKLKGRLVRVDVPWLNECLYCGEMHAVKPEWRALMRVV